MGARHPNQWASIHNEKWPTGMDMVEQRIQEHDVQHIGKVVAKWHQGGYFDRIMGAGPALCRVQAFVLACAGEGVGAVSASALQRPEYPLFPGLRHRPWHNAQDYAAVRLLEAACPAIRAEALQLAEAATLDYSAAVKSAHGPGTWTVYLLSHMGVDVEGVRGSCPQTAAVLRALPGQCAAYPWGDMLFSAMGAHSQLQPHCSIDNLRVRIHLGLSVPDGCALRVGEETRAWTEGRCLVFEDSFEHEVWNLSDQRRIVLIADLWHPELTEIETQALSAGFCKSEVRRIFMGDRLGMTQAPQAYLSHIEAALVRQDQDPVIQHYWGG